MLGVYGGSASDRPIRLGNGLIKYMHTTDSITADKGFKVQGLFKDSNVQVNIPEFFKSKTRLPE